MVCSVWLPEPHIDFLTMNYTLKITRESEHWIVGDLVDVDTMERRGRGASNLEELFDKIRNDITAHQMAKNWSKPE